MALTATLTLSPSSTANVGQPVNLAVAITNTSLTTAFNVQEIAPNAVETGSNNTTTSGAFNWSAVNIGPNSPTLTVLANSTLTVPLTGVFFISSSYPAISSSTNAAPAAGNNNGSVNSTNTFTVGANITLIDQLGNLTNIAPSTTTITITAVPLPCSN